MKKPLKLSILTCIYHQAGGKRMAQLSLVLPLMSVIGIRADSVLP